MDVLIVMATSIAYFYSIIILLIAIVLTYTLFTLKSTSFSDGHPVQ